MARFLAFVCMAVLAFVAVDAETEDERAWRAAFAEWQAAFDDWKQGNSCDQSRCPGMTDAELIASRSASIGRYTSALLASVDIPTFQYLVRSALEPDVVLNVPATGAWTGVESVVEYTAVTKPSLNGGLYQINKYDINQDSVRWNGDTMSFTTSEEFFWPTLIGTDLHDVTLQLSSNYSVTFSTCSPLIKSMVVDIDPRTVPRGSPVNITQLCGGIMQTCTGDNIQYDGFVDCFLFMSSLPNSCGTYALKGNTQFCREFHLLNALINPNVHCKHTGKSGGGVCVSSVACPEPSK